MIDMLRCQVMHLLRVLSETTSQSITEIMEPHKDILNEMIPPKKHLLRYQPANAQIGLMVCRLGYVSCSDTFIHHMNRLILSFFYSAGQFE